VSELKRVGEIIPDVLRSIVKPNLDTLARADRSLGRMDMIATVLSEINTRINNQHTGTSLGPNARITMGELSDWLAEQAERERP